MERTIVQPVRKEITVEASLEHAFRVFTERMGEWWPVKRYSVHEDLADEAGMELRLGGALFELWRDGRESWGEVKLPLELVLNKVDAVDPLRRRRLGNRFPDAVHISARTGEGLDALRARVADRFAERWRVVRLLVPHGEGRILTELYELGAPIEERRDLEEGVLVQARLPQVELSRFAPYLVAEPAASSARRA